MKRDGTPPSILLLYSSEHTYPFQTLNTHPQALDDVKRDGTPPSILRGRSKSVPGLMDGQADGGQQQPQTPEAPAPALAGRPSVKFGAAAELEDTKAQVSELEKRLDEMEKSEQVGPGACGVGQGYPVELAYTSSSCHPGAATLPCCHLGMRALSAGHSLAAFSLPFPRWINQRVCVSVRNVAFLVGSLPLVRPPVHLNPHASNLPGCILPCHLPPVETSQTAPVTSPAVTLAPCRSSSSSAFRSAVPGLHPSPHLFPCPFAPSPPFPRSSVPRCWPWAARWRPCPASTCTLKPASPVARVPCLCLPTSRSAVPPCPPWAVRWRPCPAAWTAWTSGCRTRRWRRRRRERAAARRRRRQASKARVAAALLAARMRRR